MTLTYRSLALAAAFLVISLLVSQSACDLISKRHSRNLGVGKPDDPKFELKALSKDAYMVLFNKDLKELWPDAGNPFEDEPVCDRRAEFRNIDGTCNNLAQPFLGASKTPLGRLVRGNEYEDGVNSPTATFFATNDKLPLAREVSVAVHDTQSDLSNRHSHLLAAFGQFTDHDISLSPESEPEEEEKDPKELCCKIDEKLWEGDLEECFPLIIPKDDIFQRKCIPFFRSAPTPGFPGSPIERFNLNDLTAFIDGSQIYGSTNEVAKTLRTFRNGRLRTSRGLNNEDRLPLSDNNPPNCFAGEEECTFLAGDIRNSEQAALTSLHTLFLREHNRIAEEIQDLNPRFSDEEVYQTTRKIVGAIMQRITYNEFLPEVLGPRIMRKFRLTLREGTRRDNRYNIQIDPSVLNEFSTAAFRFGHSLIRETFATNGLGGNLANITDIFNAFRTVDKVGSDGLLSGLTAVNMENKDRFINGGLRNRLFGMELDLPAFNIQRGRDHGIASYADLRRALGLNVQRRFSRLIGRTHNKDAVDALADVYPQVEDMEIFPAAVSETPLEGAIVGQTMANTIGEQFRRLKFGDRFWHETNNRFTRFSNAQLVQIRKVTLASVFCLNVDIKTVREKLLLTEDVPGNSPVSCSRIPAMDFTPWKE